VSEQAKEYGIELVDKLLRWINDEDFMEEQFQEKFALLKRELNVLKVCVNGELPGAKFEVGEFVYSKGRKNDNDIVEIGSRSYTEKRSWVYSINYVKINKEKMTVSGGGSSCWWDEKDFQKIDDPLLLLIIKKHNLEREQKRKENQLDSIQKNQDRIRYALQVVKGASL
jgi:hypothetical protein